MDPFRLLATCLTSCSRDRIALSSFAPSLFSIAMRAPSNTFFVGCMLPSGKAKLPHTKGPSSGDYQGFDHGTAAGEDGWPDTQSAVPKDRHLTQSRTATPSSCSLTLRQSCSGFRERQEKEGVTARTLYSTLPRLAHSTDSATHTQSTWLKAPATHSLSSAILPFDRHPLFWHHSNPSSFPYLQLSPDPTHLPFRHIHRIKTPPTFCLHAFLSPRPLHFVQCQVERNLQFGLRDALQLLPSLGRFSSSFQMHAHIHQQS